MWRREPYTVPDRVFWTLSVMIVIVGWGIGWWIYRDLPSTIPSHFGWNGLPDAHTATTFWSFFFPTMVGTVITVLLGWLSRHPRWMNLPGSLLIRAVPPAQQEKIVWAMRHMLAVVTVYTNLIFLYLTISVIRVSIGQASGISNRILLVLIGLILLSSVVYTAMVYQVTSTIKRPTQ